MCRGEGHSFFTLCAERGVSSLYHCMQGERTVLSLCREAAPPVAKGSEVVSQRSCQFHRKETILVSLSPFWVPTLRFGLKALHLLAILINSSNYNLNCVCGPFLVVFNSVTHNEQLILGTKLFKMYLLL